MYNTDSYGDAVTEDLIRIQRNVWREQKRIWDAFQTAKKFGVSETTLKRELKERGFSYGDIGKIIRGTMDVVPYSKPRMESKIERLEKNDEASGYNKRRSINKDSFYPRRELDEVLKNLRRQRFDEPFYYDPIEEDNAPDLTSMKLPNLKENIQTTKIETPPLPPQPAATQVASATTAPINPATGLTTVETALLSPSEQAIRLKQRV